MNSAIIIVTHGNFGSAMLAACERILGPQPRCASIDLLEGMGRQDLTALIQAKRDEFGPCLILVDMLGGTPWNAALASGLPPQDEVLAGISLPLLVEAMAVRDRLNPREIARALASKAAAAVSVASEFLGRAGT